MPDHTPSYPASTASSGPGGGVPAPPPTPVNAAFWLYIASAAISLIALIVSVATIGPLTDDLRRQLASQGQQVSDSAVSAAIGASIAISVVIGVLYIAAYVIFAVFMRRGANWARIVLLIVTALSLFGIVGGYGLGAVRVVLGVIATVLIFLKPANDYFAAAKARRRPTA